MALGKLRIARAIAIRDHVLPLIREHGTLDRHPFGKSYITTTRWFCTLSGETLPERAARTDQGLLIFSLRTPFSNWDAVRSPVPSYAQALAKQQATRGRPVLGYGLDIWRSGSNKVLSIEWDDDGRSNLISMKPGAWEEECLALD